MTCFLDIQGFSLEEEYIFKELAIVCAEGKSFHVWTFKPPCPFNHLNFQDRHSVTKEVNSKVGLLWEDGDVPYKSLASVFVTIAREFKHWYVESTRVRRLIFPFKSMSVQIELVPSTWNDSLCGHSFAYPNESIDNKGDSDDDDDVMLDDVCEEGKLLSPQFRCIYSHNGCAVHSVICMYNDYVASRL